MCNIKCYMPRTPPPFFPFPDLDRPACSALLFNNYLSAWPSSSERAMPRFRRGSSAAVVGRSGVRGGGALASTAAAAPSFMSGYLVFQASILHATYFLQGLVDFVVDFVQLLHGAGVPVQEVKPGINHGILSLPEGRHSEEARQTGHHHLRHA
jgi:hypothetical protein